MKLYVYNNVSQGSLGTRMVKEGEGAMKALATCSAQNEFISSNLERRFCSLTSEGSVLVPSMLAPRVGTEAQHLNLKVFGEEWNSFNETIEISNF